MTAHAPLAHGLAPRARHHEATRPRRRFPFLGIAMTCLLLGVLLLGAEHVPATAHAACTWGTPPGTSCVDALVLVGYP